MDCLNCPKACECHNETVHLLAELQDVAKMLNRGALIQAIEDLDLAITKLDKRHKERIGRIGHVNP